jgi:cellulose synthase/poly-beta-1,6-N-acetylglucosamine synthase-like glycosyltransferase
MTENSEAAIIIPAYNEASAIRAVISSAKKHFIYVLCVNDGSQDETSEAIRQAGATLLEHCVNLGAGAATQTGVNLTDPHVGLRVFNRKFASELKLTMPGFAHASELVHRIAEGKYKYAELPVNVSYSDYSKAKGQSMMNAVNITVDLFHHRISKK